MLARTLAAAAFTCAAAAAGAQTPGQPTRDGPVAAPPPYRSAFKDYRPYAEEPLAPWREVNETVQRVGGHVGVLRADERSAPPQPAAPASPAAAKEQSHDAHDRK
jgi:hypothetical protein